MTSLGPLQVTAAVGLSLPLWAALRAQPCRGILRRDRLPADFP